MESALHKVEMLEHEQREISPIDIRFAAMNLLARREHTTKELVQKLKRRFSDDALVKVELQRLTDENLQSDERFAEEFVRYRSSLGFGLIHVRQDMRRRGLSDIEILLALESAKIDWCAIAIEVFYKKFGEQPAANIKDKARRIRFMEYRGFCSDQYRHLV
jgi:regulatory protein